MQQNASVISRGSFISINKDDCERFIREVENRKKPCIIIGCHGISSKSPVLSRAIATKVLGSGNVYLLSSDACLFMKHSGMNPETYAWGGQ